MQNYVHGSVCLGLEEVGTLLRLNPLSEGKEFSRSSTSASLVVSPQRETWLTLVHNHLPHVFSTVPISTYRTIPIWTVSHMIILSFAY